MMVFLLDLYLHGSLSKKHLRYSFLPTVFLLSGMGLKVATSPISLTYFFHYFLFILLLSVLVIDHRLYLYIPQDFVSSAGKTKLEVEKVSLPSFSSIHPLQTSQKTGINSYITSFSQILQDIKQTIATRMGLSPPVPTAASQTPPQISSPSHMIKEMPVQEEEPFIHPAERDTNSILTTKQLLTKIGSQSLDYLDTMIDNTRMEECSFLDSFFSTPVLPKIASNGLEGTELFEMLQNMPECALIISRGVVIAVNDQFSSLIDRPKADIINQDFIQFVAPEGFTDFKTHCMNRLSGNKSQQFPIVLLTKKHQRIHLRVQIQTMKINNEDIDITVFSTQKT